MRINRISVWSIEVPLYKPYFLMGGRQRFDVLDSTLIRIDTSESLHGWGESCPWGSTYTPAHPPGVRAGIKTLAPALLGQDPRSPEHINRLMDAALPGHHYVKSGLDTACWDLVGKVAEMPLWQLFGGEGPDPVPSNTSVGTKAPEEMAAEMLEWSDRGYRTHSVKLGSMDVGLDIARIKAVDEAVRVGDTITFDANRGWTPSVAIEVLNNTMTSHWVEQPCETISQCAHVASRVQNPILLDECLNNFEDHLQAWRLGACEGAKIKPNRLGGLSKARLARDFGVSVGWRMHVEDLGGCGLANMAALHLASATPPAHRMASWVGDELLDFSLLADQAPRTVDGYACVPVSPGLGIDLDVDVLGEPDAVYE